MALTTEELLKEFDLPTDLDDIKKVREKFNQTYIGRATAADDEEIKEKIVGSFAGSVMTRLKTDFGLTNEDIVADGKPKKLENIVKLAAEKTKNKILELENAAKAGADENYKKLEKDYLKIKGEFEEHKGVFEKLKGESENLKTDYEKKLKGISVSGKLKEAKSKLTFVDGITELAKKGFDSHLNESYEFDEDETGSLVVKDKKTGQALKNEKGTGYLTAEDVLKRDAIKEGILKLNNQPPRNNNVVSGNGGQQNQPRNQAHPNVGKYRS